MSDMVNELRELADDGFSIQGLNWRSTLLSHAADEIGQLRAEIRTDNGLINELHLSINALAAQNNELREALKYYEKGMSISWPQGANGEAYDNWNEARKIALALPVLSHEPFSRYKNEILKEVKRMLNDTPTMLFATELNKMIEECK